MEMTTKQVAERLGVSPTRVYQLVTEGKLSTVNKKVKGKRFFPKFDSVDVELYVHRADRKNHKPLTPLPPMPRHSGRESISSQIETAIKQLKKVLDQL